jgi:hypothetical protein
MLGEKNPMKRLYYIVAIQRQLANLSKQVRENICKGSSEKDYYKNNAHYDLHELV